MMTRNVAASMVLRGLKDFQRDTVEYVFRRMFDDAKPATRFLVADEVGLGKTMIAKGVLAKIIDRYARTDERIDIVYVCSNAEIATQNIRRLLLPGQSAMSKANRLTLLPLYTRDLEQNAVNVIGFTPGTALPSNNGAGRRTGRKEERHLIYQMLRDLPDVSERGLLRALKATAGDDWEVEARESLEYDRGIAKAYRQAIRTDRALFRELRDIADIHHDGRRTVSDEDRERRAALTGELRTLLARTCLVALKPALVVLDEFQRFNDLFDDPAETENPAAELAHQLFNYEARTRVLLLSATPYKMYARNEESEDHYDDFLHTLKFLYPGEQAKVDALKADISAMRTGLLGARGIGDFAALEPVKERIERTLRHVMCRTERVEATRRADSMVRESLLVPFLRPRDLADFRSLESIAQAIKEPETIEYWKSSPYLLNFMDGYKLKETVCEQVARTSSPIHAAFAQRRLALLSQNDLDNYREIDPGNARLRALIGRIDADGLWKLLWMPPSLNYWQAGGEYADVGPVSKQLVFSAWNVVPDALAALLSYEAERRLTRNSKRTVTYANMPDRFAQQLRFPIRRGSGPSGMSALLLAFPSQALAQMVDPLALRAAVGVGVGVMPAYAELRERAMAIIEPAIEPLIDRSVKEGPFDRRWYWLVLARLEAGLHPAAREWCALRWAEARRVRGNEEFDTESAFDAHVRLWLDAWDGKSEDMGRVPDDLVTVLASVALCAPATCALRTLLRVWPHDMAPEDMLDAAARIAEGLRSQFNSSRAVAMLKTVEDEDSYWQSVLQYAADGNLQALLDEYAHILFESSGLADRTAEAGCEMLAEAMYEAMSLRSAPLQPDEVEFKNDLLGIKPFETRIRTHFALRFGNQQGEDGALARRKVVQAAFNSPFWPFVLASTSVGQEGLDFHNWCHSVVHWNLPSNPVDMEQREGRVHRYKGYAVRKNVARRHGPAALRHTRGDLWNTLFDLAVQERAPGTNDLIPYWIYEDDDGAYIERTVMMLPLSRDESRYRQLKRSLALYRLVFAQPRQEDLLSCLEQNLSEEDAAASVGRWRISLGPRRADGEGGADGVDGSSKGEGAT
ncbi:helicase-related protein [Paraburkholderia sp. XV]|uniref:helicase-related protein n=1 Tax=Paraburkholderia sp. XV TaxID=2831520 RepID=UPI001CD68E44|nr:helicase-related protein [Paraburkholderia sp. XV]